MPNGHNTLESQALLACTICGQPIGTADAHLIDGADIVHRACFDADFEWDQRWTIVQNDPFLPIEQQLDDGPFVEA